MSLDSNEKPRRREAGETGATHAEAREAGTGGRVCFRERRAAGITRAGVEGHHRIAIIVRFLDEHFSFAREHDPPDIAGAVSDRF